MERHARFLETIEGPYYTNGGTLKEDLLKADFEAKHGALRARLSETVRVDAGFARAFAQ
jgi:hypothetical protein